MSEFERVTTRHLSRDTPTLAVYSQGAGRLNTAAVEQWFSDVDSVQVFVDRENDLLGLARAPDGVDGLTLTPDGRGASLSLRRPLAELGIDRAAVESAVHLPLEHDPDEGLLIAHVAAVREATGDE